MAVTADTETVFVRLCTADPDVMDRDDLATYVKTGRGDPRVV